MPSPKMLLTAVAIGLFLMAAACALVALLRKHTSGIGNLAVWCLLSGGSVCLLTALLLAVLGAGEAPSLNRFDCTAFYVFTLSLAGLCLLVRHRTQGVMAFLLPYASMLLLFSFPAVDAAGGFPPLNFPLFLMMTHLAVAYVGYALLSLASILAIVYLVQDRNLKHRRFGIIFERLPALETLDHLMSRLVGVAFLLITVSLVLGFYMVHQSGGGAEWITDPKVMATMLTWALCALLVHLRASAGRHGTRLALLTAAGLFLVLLSMFGVHMVASSIHDFAQAGGRN